MIQDAGSQLATADAAVLAAGVPVRVFAIHVISGGGGAAVLTLRNGSTASGTVWVTETGTTSRGKTVSFGTQGILFPAGCFVDFDTNTASVLVTYSKA